MLTIRYPHDAQQAIPDGMRPGRWWVWPADRLSENRVGPSVNWYVRQLRGLEPGETRPVNGSYAPVLDTELVPHAEREATILRVLAEFERHSVGPVPIIQWSPGSKSPEWFLERQLAALEGKNVRDRAEMFATAKRHREIVKRAGCATFNVPCETPERWDGVEGPTGLWSERRWTIAQARASEQAHGYSVRKYAWLGSCPAGMEQELAKTVAQNYDVACVYVDSPVLNEALIAA